MPGKYKNRKTEIDGLTFDSRKEALRYTVLRDEAKAGVIHGLELQVKFPIAVNGKTVCTYIADFCYNRDGEPIVEDVKGIRTAVYLLKRKLMKAVHGITILET
jgi:hypothetical protein